MKRFYFVIIAVFTITIQLKSENLDTISANVIELFKQEKFEECFSLADKLYNESVKQNDTILTINSLYYKGFSSQRMGKMDDALKYNLQCYELALAAKKKNLQSSVLNNIGNVYMVNDMDSVAAEFFMKSINIERELGRRQQLAVRLGNISTAYMKMGRFDKAIRAAEEGLRIDREVGNANKIAIRLNQLGNVYQASGRLQDAKQCERESYVYFQKAGSKYGMSVVSHSLGDLFKEENIIDSAVFYYEQSLDLAKAINNQLLVQKISKSLYKANKEINPSLAIEFLENYVAIKDSIFDAENQQLLNDFQIKYETREKELEIAMQKETIAYNRNALRQGLYVVLLLVLSIVLLIINSIYRRRRNVVLEELNELKNRSISVLSHDLKNPVIAQKMVLHQLNDNIDNMSKEEVKTYVDALTDSIDSLEDLLVNLLEWTKVQMNKKQYNPVNFDVKDVCFRDVVPLFKGIAKKKNITIRECDIRLDDYVVHSDLKMISAVLRNLISNALKFSHIGGEVVICFSDCGDSIKIAIKDKGVGIADEKINRLLSGDFLSTMGTSGEEGTGLGIDIVNKMLYLCNSKLNIESAVGGGSEFSFELRKKL